MDHMSTMNRMGLAGLVLLLLCVHAQSWAQPVGVVDTLRGVVVEQDAQGRFQPLPMAHVYWLGTQRGTTTNAQGAFTLSAHPETRQLVIRYTGYEPDTLFIRDYRPVQVVLRTQTVWTGGGDRTKSHIIHFAC